jgi:hypothetical protein
VFPVRYELGFYIRVEGILHSRRSENLKSYILILFIHLRFAVPSGIYLSGFEPMTYMPSYFPIRTTRPNHPPWLVHKTEHYLTVYFQT